MTTNPLTRRAMLLLSTAALAAGCASTAPATDYPPIVFVHGNGDTAALWMTTIWRFESNGWPRERLHAIDVPYPLARDADDKPQPGRTSTAEHMQFLAAEVDRVLQASGARQVVLIGNSRGGNAIRNYLRSGGAGKVSHVVLGGTPNHGVWADAASRPMSEFNGAGPFLAGLNNQGGAGVEITPGPLWLTVRSDNNDKFAQPDGAAIGTPGKPTFVDFDGPALRGAQNLVLPGVDHRETSFSPAAFALAWRFLSGKEAATTAVVPEAVVVLDGKVSGLGLDNDPARGSFATNLPLAGATVEVFSTDSNSGERRVALSRKVVGADGRWGPLSTDAATPLEFVISAPGYTTSHIYRAPFARSSSVVNLRADRLADADRNVGAVLTLTRPRGYFDLRRDRISFDGQSPPPGVSSGVATVSTSRIKLPAGAPGAPFVPRAVAAQFNTQRLVGRSWPAADNHTVLLELHD